MPEAKREKSSLVQQIGYTDEHVSGIVRISRKEMEIQERLGHEPPYFGLAVAILPTMQCLLVEGCRPHVVGYGRLATCVLLLSILPTMQCLFVYGCPHVVGYGRLATCIFVVCHMICCDFQVCLYHVIFITADLLSVDLLSSHFLSCQNFYPFFLKPQL